MATKKYLDYAGLKRVLAKLLPGARKIWHGTLAEWKALSEAERDKYDQAEIIDGSGNGNGNGNGNDNDNGVTPELIRNLHDPDWSQAVSITADQLVAGYTVPKRGIIVGSVLAVNSVAGMDIKVNDVVIGRSTHNPGQWASHSSIQAPVNKNDVVKVTQDISSGNVDMSFVPYKAQ